MGRMLLKGHRT